MSYHYDPPLEHEGITYPGYPNNRDGRKQMLKDRKKGLIPDLSGIQIVNSGESPRADAPRRFHCVLCGFEPEPEVVNAHVRFGNELDHQPCAYGDEHEWEEII
jgi:hypothetical protein